MKSHLQHRLILYVFLSMSFISSAGFKLWCCLLKGPALFCFLVLFCWIAYFLGIVQDEMFITNFIFIGWTSFQMFSSLVIHHAHGRFIYQLTWSSINRDYFMSYCFILLINQLLICLHNNVLIQSQHFWLHHKGCLTWPYFIFQTQFHKIILPDMSFRILKKKRQ